jgi:Fe-S-cluster-containing hydrogenase component 2
MNQMNHSLNFYVDYDKCIGCGQCRKVCPGGILYLNEEKKAAMEEISSFGWDGCWKCEHCLAVCPVGAIRIFGHTPEDSLLPVQAAQAAPVLDALIANRHSCRRFLDRDVEPEVTADMLARLGNAPNGGNKQQVEFTLIDDREDMRAFRERAYREMERLASQGIYPEGFDRASYEDMKRWEATVRPDMLFCGAPHLLIPHAPVGKGEPVQDVLIAGTYFELLCASRGLGAVMLTFPLGVLNLMPEIRAMLQIPRDHYIGMLIGFGYPEIRYARGVQRGVEENRIHRPLAKR